MGCETIMKTIYKRRKELKKVMDEAKEYTNNKTILALAEEIGVSPQTLYAQADTGYFSPKISKKINEMTDDNISRERCNPRIYG